MFAPPSSRVVRQQLCQCLVNLRVTFGKRRQSSSEHPPLENRLVAGCGCGSRKTEGREQVHGNDILCEFPRPQQFVILKRFPPIFHGVESRVKTMQCVCRCGSSAREVSWVNCAATNSP